MLSNASKYAVRATLYLVSNTDSNNKIGSKFIADELQIPEPFLAKLLQQLVRGGLLSSSKGPHGGFFVSEDDKKNSVCDIIEEIDGHPMFDKCFLGLEKCSADNPCPLHHLVVVFKENLFQKFNELTLSEFADDIETKGHFLSLKN